MKVIRGPAFPREGTACPRRRPRELTIVTSRPFHAPMKGKRRNRMSERKKDELLNDHNHDGIDRRGFLKCMA